MGRRSAKIGVPSPEFRDPEDSPVPAIPSQVNAWVGDSRLRPAESRLDQELQWKPVDADGPALDLYPSGRDWRERFEPGDRCTFSIRHGGPGFWTVDMASIHAVQRAWQGKT